MSSRTKNERASHEGSSPFKQHFAHAGHLSPPLTGTRGYPYPQDPQPSNIRQVSSTGSYIFVPPSPSVASQYASSIYKDSPFRVQQSEFLSDGARYNSDRIPSNHHIQARRRLSLLPPTIDYNERDHRDRYIESYQQRYDPVASQPPSSHSSQGVVIPATNSSLTPVNIISASNVNHGLPGGHHSHISRDEAIINKRPRLSIDPKYSLAQNNLHQPLMVETWPSVEVKKEPAYNPQVEAISPTLPSDDGKLEINSNRAYKDELLQSISRVDREIAKVESQMSKLRKKQLELEIEASKPADSKQDIPELTETKNQSVAQIIYSENRKKAEESAACLNKMGPKVELPLYNQPCDTQIYHENRKRFLTLRHDLIKYFKKQNHDKQLREKYLAETYGDLLQTWTKKLEKKENNANKRAKDLKLREFYEKQFPELKKQREDKERISRVGTRIRSDAEFEEIMDGLQEQEMEDKKMRSYAVIPPIILDVKSRKIRFTDKNGLVEDPMTEYKDRQLVNIWTEQEKEIFKEKYFQHPKNFGLIASYLERKTVSDCVQYYYLTKKSENYKQLLRKHAKKRSRQFQKPQQQQQSQNISNVPGITTRQLAAAAAAAAAAQQQSENPDDSKVDKTSVSSASSVPVSEVAQTNKDELNLDKNNSENGDQKSDGMVEKAPDKTEGNDRKDTKELAENESHSCVICKVNLKSCSQSRPLNKSNCSLYGLKESELTPEARICSSCRFKSVRRRCPIPSCRTPKQKVKRLRPLPIKWSELDEKIREPISKELQITPDITKCCSACFNRITRRLGANSSGDSLKPAANNDGVHLPKWTDEEISLIKTALKDHGNDWCAVAQLVSSKTKEQCKDFYLDQKKKLGLDVILEEWKKNNHSEDKPDGRVSGEESGGESTSSCDEIGFTSDTASAPSPISISTENANQREKKETAKLNSEAATCDGNLQDFKDLSASQGSLRSIPDNDSSATLSADESHLQAEPDVIIESCSTSHSHAKLHPKVTYSNMNCPPPNSMGYSTGNMRPFRLPSTGSVPNSAYPNIQTSILPPGHPYSIADQLANKKTPESNIGNLIFNTIEQRLRPRDLIASGIPIEKLGPNPELNQLKAPQSVDKQRLMMVPEQVPMSSQEPNKNMRLCSVRDLMFHTIEKSLQDNSVDNSESNTAVVQQQLHPSQDRHHLQSSSSLQSVIVPQEVASKSKDPPPVAHESSRMPNNLTRPEGLAMMAAPYAANQIARGSEYEVQDLSRKDKPKDQTPILVNEIKRERTIVRNSPEVLSLPFPGRHEQRSIYHPPPPAHSNQMHRAGQSHNANDIESDSRRESYYPRPDSRNSRSPSMYPSRSVLHSVSPRPSRSNKIVSSSSVNGPHSSQLSPKHSFKGSITQGTPLNHHAPNQPLPVMQHLSPRYEGLFRQLPPTHPKDVGSITLGTPVQHDIKKGMRPEFDGRSSVDNNLQRTALPVMQEPNSAEHFYRRLSPNGPGMTPYYYSNVSGPRLPSSQRPPFANESQLSARQISIDFNTSKQMQMRRGSTSSDKDSRLSPRLVQNHSPLAQQTESHPHMPYPYPLNATGSSSSNRHMYLSPGDGRMNRNQTSQISVIDGPHSSSVGPTNVSVASWNQGHRPSSVSPSVISNLSTFTPPPRQNVIHRGTPHSSSKPSPVIQSRHSNSPQPVDRYSPMTSISKNCNSPRNSHSYPPSSLDAFAALVDAAVAQPSLAIPNRDDKKSLPSPLRHEELVKDHLNNEPDQVVEFSRRAKSEGHPPIDGERRSGMEAVDVEREHQHRRLMMQQQSMDDRKYVAERRSVEYGKHPHDLKIIDNERDRHVSRESGSISNYKLPGSREPFTHEQFERELRQQTMDAPRDEEKNKLPGSSLLGHESKEHQVQLEQEASRMLSNSFQKDEQKPPSSSKGFTDIIAEIIKHQINQPEAGQNNVKAKNGSGNNLLFNRYSEEMKCNPSESSIQNNSYPHPSFVDSSGSRSLSPVGESRSQHIHSAYSNSDKAITLGEHIAAIISKNYSSSTDTPTTQTSDNRLRIDSSVTPTSQYFKAENRPNQLDGETNNVSSMSSSHNWKSKKTMKFHDKDPQSAPNVSDGGSFNTSHFPSGSSHFPSGSSHFPSGSSSLPSRKDNRITQSTQNGPSQSSDAGLPKMRAKLSPVSSYQIEPISPPVPDSNNRHDVPISMSASVCQSSTWGNTTSSQKSMLTNGPTCEASPRKTPHSSSPRSSQQIGLSPLDYMKNKIVEVMRTTVEEAPDSSRTGNTQPQPSSSQSDEDGRDPTKFRGQPGYEVPCTSDVTQGGLPEAASLAVSQVGPYGKYSEEGNYNDETSEVSASSERCNVSLTNRSRPRSISPSSSDNVHDSQDYPAKRMRMSNSYIPESSTERSTRSLPESSEIGNISNSDRLCSSSVPSGNNGVTEGLSNVDTANVVSGSISTHSDDNFPQPSHQRESDGPESSTSINGDGEVSSVGKMNNESSEVSHNVVDSPESGNMVIDESPSVDCASSSKLEPISPPLVQDSISTSFQPGLPSSSFESGGQNGLVSSSLNCSSSHVDVSSPVASSLSAEISTSSGSYTPGSNLTPCVSGVSTTYSYPYSALSVRSMTQTSSTNSPASSSSNAPQSSAISGNSPRPCSNQSSNVSGSIPGSQSYVSESSSLNSNLSSSVSGSQSFVSGSSPCTASSAANEEELTPIMSSQYEPLSDED